MTNVGTLLLLVTLAQGAESRPTPVSGGESGAAKPAAANPRAVVAQWLEALRRKDEATLRNLMARPFLLEGFDMVTGTERRKCAANAESEKDHRLRFNAANDEAIAQLVSCLLHYKIFNSTLPKADLTILPEQIPRNVRDGRVGAIARIAPSRLPPRLKRHAGEAKQFGGECAIIHVFATDNNGLSVDAVFVVPTSGEPRVRALFLSERFEE